MDTLTYLVKVKLNKRVPNMLPMFGQKVTLSYDGSSKISKNCYDYHKKDFNCEKMSWQDYVNQFKEENPKVLGIMYDYQDEQFCDAFMDVYVEQGPDVINNYGCKYIA
jgi:hypothetical protein